MLEVANAGQNETPQRGIATASLAASEQLLQRITKTLSLQSDTLNVMTRRLLTIEAEVAKSLGTSDVPGLPELRSHGILPKMKLGEVPGQIAPITLLALDSTIENVSLGELCLIMQLVRAQGARDVFEMGTADGRTTVNLAANCAESGKVFTLNLPRGDLGSRFQNSPLRPKIQQLVGDTSTFDFSPYFNAVDFVFIDANHDYEFVMNDTLAALKLLRDGRGTIVWHDYISHWPGVVRALDQLLHSNPRLEGLVQIEHTSLAYARVSE